MTFLDCECQGSDPAFTTDTRSCAKGEQERHEVVVTLTTSYEKRRVPSKVLDIDVQTVLVKECDDWYMLTVDSSMECCLT